MRGFASRRRPAGLALLAAAALSVGCASTPYRFASHGETDLTLKLREEESQFERGEPNAWVDGFGHYFFSLPAKLVLFDWKVDNHDVSPEVEESLREYLAANGLCNVKVRINQYAPGGEWQRLGRNREMPGGWRFTLGALSVIFYTIFPERLFAGFPFIGGGDHYNPYTNTISIYSDRRPVVIHEGGHAKDFASKANRHWRGFYSAARAVPLAGLLVALVQEGVATKDALSWEQATGDAAVSKRGYRTLYPAYGTYLGGAAQSGGSLFIGGWELYVIQYGVVVVGHVAGQIRALFVRDRPEGLDMEALEGWNPSPAPTAQDAVPGELRRASCDPATPEPTVEEREQERERLLELELGPDDPEQSLPEAP